MKQFLILLCLCLSLSTQAQVTMPTDTERIARIEDSMTAFHKEYNTGTWVAVCGVALVALHYITVAQDNGLEQPILGYAGGLMLCTGGVIMIDSHKYLNVSKIPKKKL